MVRVKDLESKPELNGRYGFVDAFLRENERYMVLLPDKPGTGLALALKSSNLEKVTAINAQPVKLQPQAKSLPSDVKPKAAAAAPAQHSTAPQRQPGGSAGSGYPVAGQAST